MQVGDRERVLQHLSSSRELAQDMERLITSNPAFSAMEACKQQSILRQLAALA